MGYDVVVALGYIVAFWWFFHACRKAEHRARTVERLYRACGLREWDER